MMVEKLPSFQNHSEMFKLALALNNILYCVEAIMLTMICPKFSKLILIFPIFVPRIICIIIVVPVHVRLFYCIRLIY